MAVPSEAYQIYSLKDIIEGSVRQEFKFAKFTSPYTTLEEAKTLFRLDGAILEGTSSFIGYVNTGSVNSVYHNINRMDSYIFSNKKLLTDAGLNTLGDTNVLSVLSNNSTKYEDSSTTYKPRLNDAVVWVNFKSPYYSDISTVEVEIKDSTGTTWWGFGNIGNIEANSSGNNKVPMYGPQSVERIGTYNFRAKITNSEGTYTSNFISASIYRIMATMKYDSQYASDAYNSGSSKTIYYNTSEIQSTAGGVGEEATDFAKNDVLDLTESDIADYGYYVLGTTWYKFIYAENFEAPLVVASGPCTKYGYPSDDPEYQFEPIFSDTILGHYQEATYAVTSSDLTLYPGDVDNSTTPPSFPDATFDIIINGSVALPNTDLYFYVQDKDENQYYIGSDNTGSESTKQFQFSGTFDSIGLTPLAGETYSIFITDGY